MEQGTSACSRYDPSLRARSGRAGAAVGIGQDRDRRVRPRTGRSGDRDHLHRRDRPGARAAGIPVRSITELTGFPEIMDGRVKTLHPKLYAGLLARPRQPRPHGGRSRARRRARRPRVREPVSVRARPRRPAASRDEEVVENIDIGGPTMIRAAAKNFAFAAPVVSPESYDAGARRAPRVRAASCRRDTRESLAAKAFAYTARYDTAIARWFQEKREDFPPLMVAPSRRCSSCPTARTRTSGRPTTRRSGPRTHVLSMVSPAWRQGAVVQQPAGPRCRAPAAGEFKVPGCVIIKHNNPCGVAVAATAARGLREGLRVRPHVGLRRRYRHQPPGRRELAEALLKQFVEVLFARGYDDDALEMLATKPNMRILDDRERRTPNMIEPDLRQVDRRHAGAGPRRRPGGARRDAGRLQAPPDRGTSGASCCSPGSVCKHVRSNAIVLVRDLATIGIGAGQMSRVDSVRLALEKAQSDAGRLR